MLRSSIRAKYVISPDQSESYRNGTSTPVYLEGQCCRSSWGENTRVPRFSLPKPHTFLPSLCGSVEDRPEMLDCGSEGLVGQRGSPRFAAIHGINVVLHVCDAEQSTGCEEKNTNSSPQQPVLFRLTFNTAAFCCSVEGRTEKANCGRKRQRAEGGCCVPQQSRA